MCDKMIIISSEDDTVVPKHVACINKWKNFRNNYCVPLKHIVRNLDKYNTTLKVLIRPLAVYLFLLALGLLMGNQNRISSWLEEKSDQVSIQWECA